jgi:Lambda phage tail tube protein, TTP
MTQALLGWGSTFESSDSNSPDTFVAFGEVSGIDGPAFVIDVIDTSHEQPPESARESIPGMLDAGQVKIDFNFVPGSASTTALMAEVATRPLRYRRIVLPNGLAWRFQAYLVGFETTEAAGDPLTGSASFKIVGAATLT